MARKAPYTVLCKDTDPQWLKMRLTGIGASSMATALGISPYGSAYGLCLELMGDVEPADLSDNEYVEWGKRLEAVVMQAYAEKSGRLAWRSGLLLRSTLYPWALCTLDGLTAEPDKPRRRWPVEIKTATESHGDEWADGPPEQYRVQINAQMLVTGAEIVTAAVLLGGHRFAWCDVERDEKLIERIIKEGGALWDRVQRRDPPPIDASEACSSAIARRYRVTDPRLVVRLPYDFVELDAQLRRLKEEKSTADGEIKRIENEIKAAIGAGEAGVLPNGVTYTWIPQTRAGYTVEPTVARVLRRKETDRE